ncbi:organic cation transporter protein-like isoform X1 [Schistocerca nitens]|uniref:organic cation transporter protein-like isoform X1 n=2 Tax=Schistocerca nitens TaxID=7011 RepID=UPI0021194DCA|nr:organic cation transporter protein-like isoform X1 [Schistocerca nitens]
MLGSASLTLGNTCEGRKMAYDDVLQQLGDFGPYQARIYLLLCLPAISCALHKLAGVFLQAKPNHRCWLPYEENNASYNLSERELNLSIPRDESTGSWSSCYRFDTNFSSEYFENNIPANCTVGCDKWIYDTTVYKSSVVTEFDLVCKNAWLRATADALFMVGVLLGSIIFGELSDRYGRKIIFFISLVLQVICGTVAAFLPDYISFMIARMLIGASTSGVFLVAYVIAMEMVGPSKRLFAGVVCQYFFTIGYLLTALLAYFIKDWRMLQISLSLPGLLFLSYWWFIPESVRWLLVKGRCAEAEQLLMKAAEENKVKIPEELLKDLLDSNALSCANDHYDGSQPERKPSIFDLFLYPNLRRKTLNIFFNWFVNSGTYYGLSWNTSNLGGNDYLNFFISGAVEVPAYTFLLLTLNRWGRKTILCGCMLTGGLALLLTIAVPSRMSWLMILLAMTGKLAITASYGTVYVFSTEQFPTVIRNVALGASSTCARVGGISAPYINLLAEYWQPFPLLIFGSLALMGGLMALVLPETMGRKLPDTIEEGERFGRDFHRAEENNGVVMSESRTPIKIDS